MTRRKRSRALGGTMKEHRQDASFSIRTLRRHVKMAKKALADNRCESAFRHISIMNHEGGAYFASRERGPKFKRTASPAYGRVGLSLETAFVKKCLRNKE